MPISSDIGSALNIGESSAKSDVGFASDGGAKEAASEKRTIRRHGIDAQNLPFSINESMFL